jgi:hypothetical protein
MGTLLGILNVVDFDRNVGQAIDAERIDANGPGGRLIMEAPRFPAEVQAELTRRGHVLAPAGEYDIRPRIQIAGVDPATGRRVGQSDPRTDFATLAARTPRAQGRVVADDDDPSVRLRARRRGKRVDLAWEGTDRGRSGVAYYALQVREPGATGFTSLRRRTGRTRLVYRGTRPGVHTFRVRAVDSAGNVSVYDALRRRLGA